MELGMVGLGRMGTNMVRRLLRAGHACVVYDLQRASVDALVKEGAVGAESLEDLARKLKPPRAVWMMTPASTVDSTLKSLVPFLGDDDAVVDGGNSHYHDDLRRSAELKPRHVHYVDVGTSGGVWGSERGYCLMIGGEDAIVKRLDPVFRALAARSSSHDEMTLPRRHTSAMSGRLRSYKYCSGRRNGVVSASPSRFTFPALAWRRRFCPSA